MDVQEQAPIQIPAKKTEAVKVARPNKSARWRVRRRTRRTRKSKIKL
jgi:hypothetical protein